MDLSSVMEIMQARLGDRIDEFILPPPVIEFMQAELLEFDPGLARLRMRFPVLEDYLNPYGVMQGGLVAAAVDNTLGPLSMLVAPPNVTRTLDMKYSRSITPELGSIIVDGRLVERQDRRLKFSADVRDQDGQLLARARAVHWILEDESAE
jgi:acyl-coenzyme A thioesterase PaaI-like protein